MFSEKLRQSGLVLVVEKREQEIIWELFSLDGDYKLTLLSRGKSIRAQIDNDYAKKASCLLG